MSANTYRTLAYNFREVPWHGVGTPIQDDISVADAVKVALADYEVVTGYPTAFYIPSEGRYIDNNEIHDGSVGNLLSILRKPSYGETEYYVLGKASEKFHIMQNARLAEIVEPLRKWGRVETVGALDNGARFFITFEGKEWDFITTKGKRDAQRIYLGFKNTHLPGFCIQIQFFNTRVVCKNTWETSNDNALMNLPLAHTADLDMMTKWVVDVLDALPKMQEEAKHKAEYLNHIVVDDQDVRQMTRKAIPMPKHNKVVDQLQLQKSFNLPDELAHVANEIDSLIERKDDQMAVASARIAQMHELVMNIYHSSDTVDRGTAWGAVQALVEAVDHGVKTNTAVRQTSKAAGSNFWGERENWKRGAFEYFKV